MTDLPIAETDERARLTRPTLSLCMNAAHLLRQVRTSKAREIADARLDGVASILWSLGYGWTPEMVRRTILDTYDQVVLDEGPRPESGSHRARAWHRTMAVRIERALTALDR